MNPNPVLRRLIETKEFKGKDRMIPVKHCVDTERGELLYETVRRHRLRRCLEVGCLFGFSSLYIAQACAEIGGTLDIVDRPQQLMDWGDGEQVDLGNAAERHIEEAGYGEIVTFYRKHSDVMLPQLLAEGKRYDFAFIDADHRFHAALLDIINVDRVLAKKGALALDDIGPGKAYEEGMDGAVNRALGFVFATSRYRIDTKGRMFCICWKLREPG